MYPDAQWQLITEDRRGSYRTHNCPWKRSLQQLTNTVGLEISICHFAPGTGKCNTIQHLMFCRITENWRGPPLVSWAVVVNLIGHADTSRGMRIQANIDKHRYIRGI